MRNIITCLLALCITTITFAQTETIFSSSSNQTFAADFAENTEKGTAVIVDVFGDAMFDFVEEKVAPKVSNEIIPNFYRTAKPLKDNFTGYSIELKSSNRALDVNDPLYGEFGGLMVQENLNPKFSYLIGDFTTIEAAQKFIDTVIISRYPTARIVKFKKGKRAKKVK